jgi:hypothetical protein
MIHVRAIGTRNPLAAGALLLIAIGALALFLVVGAVVVAGLIAAGTAFAAIVAVKRRFGRIGGGAPESVSRRPLDPGLEVFPHGTGVPPLPGPNERPEG